LDYSANFLTHPTSTSRWLIFRLGQRGRLPNKGARIFDALGIGFILLEQRRQGNVRGPSNEPSASLLPKLLRSLLVRSADLFSHLPTRITNSECILLAPNPLTFVKHSDGYIHVPTCSWEPAPDSLSGHTSNPSIVTSRPKCILLVSDVVLILQGKTLDADSLPPLRHLQAVPSSSSYNNLKVCKSPTSQRLFTHHDCFPSSLVCSWTSWMARKSRHVRSGQVISGKAGAGHDNVPAFSCTEVNNRAAPRANNFQTRN